MRLLEIANAPYHVKDRGRDEEKPRNQTTQDRLPILEHDTERLDRALEPVRRLCSRLFFRQSNQENKAEDHARDAHRDPKAVPREATTDQWTGNELSG